MNNYTTVSHAPLLFVSLVQQYAGALLIVIGLMFVLLSTHMVSCTSVIVCMASCTWNV